MGETVTTCDVPAVSARSSLAVHDEESTLVGEGTELVAREVLLEERVRSARDHQGFERVKAYLSGSSARMQSDEQSSTGFDARRLVDVNLDVLGIRTKVLRPPRQLSSRDVRGRNDSAGGRCCGGGADRWRLGGNGRSLCRGGNGRRVTSALLALVIPWKQSSVAEKRDIDLVHLQSFNLTQVRPESQTVEPP